MHRCGGKVGAEMRATARADAQPTVLITPRDQFDAGDTSAERPAGAHLAARGERIPVAGWSALRSL